ncbi:MAG: polyprenyl synthetase family protein [Planctomycetota bacterium]|jgi:geranylgeranyl diphosphate synthase, type II
MLDRWHGIAAWFDSRLVERLDTLGSGCPPRLREALGYSLLAPGKRLRPMLCLMACEAVGGNLDDSLPGAMALEMMHAYSLIHDDLPAMDDDELRRGRPTCHVQFDEATAILAGDALQPLAFQTLLDSNLASEIVRESSLVLARAVGAEGMVGGQMDDLLAEKRDSAALSLEERSEWLRSIHRRKTGALIQASVELGGIAGRANPQDRQALSEYGRAIGISFQIVDDLLDAEGTSEKTGKKTGKDSARGKLTYPAVFGIKSSREQARTWIHDAVAAIQCLGNRNEPLVWLANYILERTH